MGMVMGMGMVMVMVIGMVMGMGMVMVMGMMMVMVMGMVMGMVMVVLAVRNIVLTLIMYVSSSFILLFISDKTLLAQCLLQWLSSPQHNPNAIRWLSKREGLFQITNSTKISSLWGNKKDNKKKMNHEKLSRALRHYYKDGTLVKQPHKKRLCYKFSESAMKKFAMYFSEQ